MSLYGSHFIICTTVFRTYRVGELGLGLIGQTDGVRTELDYREAEHLDISTLFFSELGKLSFQ